MRGFAAGDNVQGGEPALPDRKWMWGAARFGANRAALTVLLTSMRAEEGRIREGGGTKAADAQKAKGRLTVRERLRLLLDSESLQENVTGGYGAVSGENFLELGLWAANGMYPEFGGAPGAGVVTGLGRVEGRLLHDYVLTTRRSKAGAFFPMTCQKGVAGAAYDCLGESDSYVLSGGFFGGVPAATGGCFFPHDPGRFRAGVSVNNAVMSSLGIPQITAIMGIVRGGRRVSAGDDGHGADDGGFGAVSWRGRLWCRRRSGRRLHRRGAGPGQRCTRRFQGTAATSALRRQSIICALRGCGRWWGR